MRRVIAHLTGGRVQLEYEDIVTFNYHECPDRQGNRITKEEWKQVHDLFSEPENLMSVEPMPRAIEGLRRLSGRGTVHLATSRLRKARKTTAKWLDAHGFPDHNLNFLEHEEKHASLKSFTAAVEDRTAIVDHLRNSDQKQAMAGDSAPRPRTAAAAHQELSVIAAAA